MERVTFTRIALHDLVWTMPVSQIAKQYDVSSMGIKSACERMQIPIPNSKYLVKARFNKELRPKLSENYTGSDSIEILKRIYEFEVRNSSKPSLLIDLINEIRNAKNAPVVVPESLSAPTEIIAKTQAYLENERGDGMLQKKHMETLNLHVTKNTIPRALRFMDALIKLLEYRGHKVGKGVYGSDLVFFNDGIEINIYLREAFKRIRAVASDDTYREVSTGEFIFRVSKGSSIKEWRDGSIPLEECLARIVSKIELMAMEERQWRAACDSSRLQNTKEAV
ncbi:hypothetical protein [Flavobacterium poyangense]|uniref:hypothetical protein n=1 Tax=Flavobacterium poyangense TaxID=2204302 RepID=UPI001424366B|nr:hypothetical protein [Flavobacterium sp. JXAS1]